MPKYGDKGKRIGGSKRKQSGKKLNPVTRLQETGRISAGYPRTHVFRSPAPGTWLGAYGATWALDPRGTGTTQKGGTVSQATEGAEAQERTEKARCQC